MVQLPQVRDGLRGSANMGKGRIITTAAHMETLSSNFTNVLEQAHEGSILGSERLTGRDYVSTIWSNKYL